MGSELVFRVLFFVLFIAVMAIRAYYVMLDGVERVLAPDGVLFMADIRRSWVGLLESLRIRLDDRGGRRAGPPVKAERGCLFL
jgi:hypothetical protein